MNTPVRISHQQLTNSARDLLLRDTHTWDRPNEIWGLLRTPLGSVKAIPMEFPEELNNRPPRTIFRTMANAAKLGVPFPPELIGIAFVAETWGLGGEAAHRRREQREQGLPVPHIGTYPGHIENRMCILGGLHGALAGAIHRRGDTNIVRFDDSAEWGGSALGALDHYLRTLRQLKESST